MNRKYRNTMVFILAADLLLGAAGSAPAQTVDDEASLKKAVVKIIVTHKEASYYQPWQMKAQSDRVGSGCVIEGNRILTNAHVVSNETYIQVLRAGEVQKYTAQVEYVGHDCDLALLTVADEEFFEGVSPVAFGTTASLRDKVSVYGFPIGGTKLSITEGVVSRLEVRNYSHSDRRLLCMQIDAAINPGNSGGPVIKDNRIVGVAFQVNRKGEGLGYVIPMPVINRFMKDVQDGTYHSIPAFGFGYEDIESKFLREYLGMKKEHTGVRLYDIQYGSSVHGIINEGDVLLKINDTDIANDGTVTFRDDERISLSYMVGDYQVGDKVTFHLLRDGKEASEDIVLKEYLTLIPRKRYDIRATYYIFAGFLFMPVTEDYCHTWSKWTSVPTKLKYHYYYGDCDDNTNQVVLISKVLAHDVNLGYHEVDDVVVDTVNGKKIGNILDVIDALEDHEGKYHTIMTDEGFAIVLDVEKARTASPEILERYGIRDHCSDDLK